MIKLTQHMKDIILAGAIGDAVGYTVEFMKERKIRDLYGPDGLRIQDIHPKSELVVSDDTQMTLFALEAMLEYDEPTAIDIYEKYRQWYLTQYNPKNVHIESKLGQFGSMQEQRAPGSTCLSALAHEYEVFISGSIDNNSKGCGAAMRAAPFGFYDDVTKVATLSGLQGKLTHHHPSGYISGEALALMIHYALYHVDKSVYKETALVDSIEFALANINTKYGKAADEVIEILLLAIDMHINDNSDAIRVIGEGWVGEEAVAIAVYCALEAETFEECINLAINHDGDSDSTGSIAAQLWVAFKGLPSEYKDWDKRLDISAAFTYIMEK